MTPSPQRVGSPANSARFTGLLRLQRAAKLLIIDELGYVPLSPTGADLLFEVFSQRYERGSTIVISNLPFEEWTALLDVLVQSRRGKRAAKRPLRKLLKRQCRASRVMITDKLPS